MVIKTVFIVQNKVMNKNEPKLLQLALEFEKERCYERYI